MRRAVSWEVPFRWQGGYAALTVSREQCQPVIEYIHRQREHHADGAGLRDKWEPTLSADFPDDDDT